MVLDIGLIILSSATPTLSASSDFAERNIGVGGFIIDILFFQFRNVSFEVGER